MSEFATDFGWWLLDVTVVLAIIAPGLIILRRHRGRFRQANEAWLVVVVPAWLLAVVLIYPIHRLFDFWLPVTGIFFTVPVVLWVVFKAQPSLADKRLDGPIGPASRAFDAYKQRPPGWAPPEHDRW